MKASGQATRSRFRGWLRSQLRITWHLPLVLGLLFAGLTAARWWSWLSATPPGVIHLKGSPAEMGSAHGGVLGEEILELFEGYVLGGLVEREGWSLADLVAIAHHYERFIPERYREEMKALAQDCGASYDHILVMNTFPDAVLGANPQACSAFAVKTSKGLLVGRNLDWTNYGVAHRYALVFVFEPEEGHRVLSVGWPGMAGVVTAMNDAGLVLTLNMAYAVDLEPDSTPVVFRLRRILEEQETVDGAVDALISEPRTIAMNVLVASGREDRAVVVELSGRQHAVVEMANDLVVTTNYYQALPIKGGAGAERTAIIRKLLGDKGTRATAIDARRALGRVCFRGSADGMVTNQSVVFLPRELAAEIAIGKLPASDGRFFRVALGG